VGGDIDRLTCGKKDGGFGRWAFQEITDPWNVKKEIRATISKLLPAVTND
jgi:hypothetical protein